MTATSSLSAPLTQLKGVGPALAQRLARLQLYSIQDLLLHLPLRYQDRSRLTPMHQLQPGQEVLVSGQILTLEQQQGRRKSLLVRLTDQHGFLRLRFFHLPRHQQKRLQVGLYLQAFGEVRLGPQGYELIHPDYQLSAEPFAAPTQARLTPVYPSTEGLHQNRLRQLVLQALPYLHHADWPDLAPLLTDLLPLSAALSAPAALQLLHQPPAAVSPEELQAALQRLALEELGVHMLLAQAQRRARQQLSARPLPQANALGKQLLGQLGFTLTGAQRRVLKEIFADLAAPTPMLRLLQGDVGAGKTVIAAFAALRATEHGCQTALMAPTEILAEQHYLNLSRWLTPLGIGLTLLTGKQSKAQRRAHLAQIASGESLILVGTHALFQQEVVFADLALVIIDEQHRFGVRQRHALLAKGNNGRQPHQLVMTATPIPRTLTMTLYADMDLSLLDELPPGRQPIQTLLLPEQRRDTLMQRLRNLVAQGQQAYWICTLIEDSDVLQASAAETTAAEMRSALPDLRIGLLHGRLPAAEKTAVMAAFKAGQLDLLVATTVVEVGVDVPNATTMVIENPERLGLAQLHQLRGRVGRGQLQSYCLLLYKTPLSAQAKARLQLMQQSQDGFALAEADLALRGPGDLLGTRQTGERDFRVADLGRDTPLLAKAQTLASRLLAEPALAQQLRQYWSSAQGSYAQV